MQPKLIVTFERLNEADFQAKVGFIIASLTNNAFYPEPWPDTVTPLQQIIDAFTLYKDAYHASLTRDTVKIGQRDLVRQNLTDMLKRLTSYLEFVAQRDTVILATTGYDLRKDIVHVSHATPLPAPSDFRVAHGPKSGTLLLRVARMQGAKSYEVQSAQGDPSVEANWTHATTSATASHINLEGLTPAQTYWLRVRAIVGGGEGVWSDPVSVIVT